MNEIFRVGLLLKDNIDIAGFQFTAEDFCYDIKFIDFNDSNNTKYCDLVIVDKETKDLNDLPETFTNTHTSPIILNTKHTPDNENAFEKVFTKSYCRFKELIVNESNIKKLIHQEIIKNLAKENSISDFNILTTKHTRLHFLKEIISTPIFYFTIIPFLLFLLNQLLTFFLAKVNINWSLICFIKNTLNQYDADCYSNEIETLKFFAFLFTLLNLLAYFNYISIVTRKVNDDVFQSFKSKFYSSTLYYLVFFFLIISFSTIVISSLLFIFEFHIFKQNNLNSINSIINVKSAWLNGNYIIYYFLSLDILLFLYIKQILFVDRITNYDYHSSKARKVIKDAKLNFLISLCWDTAIILNTLFLSYSISDNDNLLVIQLFTLQVVYIYLNISSSLSQYKYS